jgi:hypothetical protein
MRFPFLPLLVLAFLSVGFQVCTLSAAEKSEKAEKEWVELLSAKQQKKWVVVKKDLFKDAKVAVTPKLITLGAGDPAAGIRWTGEFPSTEYEIELETRRTTGSDFFCGLTFPVQKSEITLVLGGWGGGVCGLSCIDGFYAVENESALGFEFKEKQWYKIRVKVSGEMIIVHMDDKEIIKVDTEGKKLESSVEMSLCGPLGIATWKTTGEIRGIRYRKLAARASTP